MCRKKRDFNELLFRSGKFETTVKTESPEAAGNESETQRSGLEMKPVELPACD